MAGEKLDKMVYEQKVLTMGTAGTHKVSNDSHALHYWARENAKGEIDIYYLKPDSTVSPIVAETVLREVFDKRFHDCSTHQCELRKLSAEEKAAQLVEEKVRTGDAHLEKNEFNAAKFEYGQALKMDDEHLRAHLGKGKAHLATGEVAEAEAHFEKMAAIPALYDEDNMHTFNELGITLRRSGMYEKAIGNYLKALEIDPEDEVLHYNIARAFKDSGNLAEAESHIMKAMGIRADFKEAKAFLEALKK